MMLPPSVILPLSKLESLMPPHLAPRLALLDFSCYEREYMRHVLRIASLSQNNEGLHME